MADKDKGAVRPPAITPEQKAAARKARAEPTAATKLAGKPKPAAKPKASKGKGEPIAEGLIKGDLRMLKYPPEIREAVKMAKAIRGKTHGAGPKQHVIIRETVLAEIKANGGGVPTPARIAEVAGFKSFEDLLAVARGGGDRTATRPMAPLLKKVPETVEMPDGSMARDPWTQGRHAAAALAAWGEQLARKA
jgi:hypothetical protein